MSTTNIFFFNMYSMNEQMRNANIGFLPASQANHVAIILGTYLATLSEKGTAYTYFVPRIQAQNDEP